MSFHGSILIRGTYCSNPELGHFLHLCKSTNSEFQVHWRSHRRNQNKIKRKILMLVRVVGQLQYHSHHCKKPHNYSWKKKKMMGINQLPSPGFQVISAFAPKFLSREFGPFSIKCHPKMRRDNFNFVCGMYDPCNYVCNMQCKDYVSVLLFIYSNSD